MKKKIIYVITRSFWGGGGRYVFDLAANLPKESFDILVIAGGNDFLIKKLKEKNIATISIPYLERDINIFSDIKTFFFLLKLFRREKPDIIHLNCSKIGGIGALAGKLARVKKIFFTAHGWAFNEDRPWLVKKMFKFIIWLSLLLHDKIIAVSTAVIENISDFPFVSKKIILIHNGIEKMPCLTRHETKIFFQKKFSFLKQCPIETVWIGTIAELTKNKGLKYAIEAMAKIKKLPFVFIIIGEGRLKENLKSQIRNLELEKKIFLTGYLDKAQKYLSAFDIFTLTSITEAFGYVILEAGLGGLPVIATNVGGIPEIIINKKNGLLVKPKNSKEIAIAIDRLIKNPQMRKILGENLKQTVRKKFSFNQMLEKTFTLYQ